MDGSGTVVISACDTCDKLVKDSDSGVVTIGTYRLVKTDDYQRVISKVKPA
jgi:hypothetical protein